MGPARGQGKPRGVALPRGHAGLPPNAGRAAAHLPPPGAGLTCDVELLIGDLRLQVDPAPLLRVVHPAEAGHVDHTLLVHVHVAGCERRERRVSEAGQMDPKQPLLRVLVGGAQVKTRHPLTRYFVTMLLATWILCYNVVGHMESWEQMSLTAQASCAPQHPLNSHTVLVQS